MSEYWESDVLEAMTDQSRSQGPVEDEPETDRLVAQSLDASTALRPEKIRSWKVRTAVEDVLGGMPTNWQRRLRTLIRVATGRVGVFLLGIALTLTIMVVLQFEVQELWKNRGRPWIGESGSVPHWILVPLVANVLFSFLIAVCFFFQFGNTRIKQGSINTLEDAVAELTKEKDELLRGQAMLTGQLETLEDLTSSISVTPTLFSVLNLVRYTDTSVFELLADQKLPLKKRPLDRFFEGLFEKLFLIFAKPNDIRACIYIPDPSNREWLIISDWECVGAIAKQKNKWYIGNINPNSPGRERGIPGSVFCGGIPRVIQDPWTHTEFHNVYPELRTDPATQWPYSSMLLYPLPNSGGHSAARGEGESDSEFVGLLVLDSGSYSFSDQDLSLVSYVVEQVASVLSYWQHQEQV